MKLNQLRDNPGARKDPICVGRGIGCGKGKTSGRGVKGQKARSGVNLGGYEGGQMPLFRRMPKRGFKNHGRCKFAIINLGRLQDAIDSGMLDAKETINGQSLRESGVLSRVFDGVRLLARGEIKAKVRLEVAGASKAAVEAVEKAGGSVTILGGEVPAGE